MSQRRKVQANLGSSGSAGASDITVQFLHAITPDNFDITSTGAVQMATKLGEFFSLSHPHFQPSLFQMALMDR